MYGIKSSELLKKAIFEKLRRKQVEELESKSEEMSADLVKFTSEYVVKSIREYREKQ